jgi:hypothetical protein
MPVSLHEKLKGLLIGHIMCPTFKHRQLTLTFMPSRYLLDRPNSPPMTFSVYFVMA